jgi:hypothetical protein
VERFGTWRVSSRCVDDRGGLHPATIAGTAARTVAGRSGGGGGDQPGSAGAVCP